MSGSGAEPEPWVAPAVRGDSLLLTWGALLAGHTLVTVLAVLALGGLMHDRRGAAVAAFGVAGVLGIAGGAVAVHGLRVTVAVRRAEHARTLPTPPGPDLVVLAIGLALLAIGLGIIVVVQWSAGGVLPAVGGELVFLPLGLRTQRYAQDVAGAVSPPAET